MSMVGAAPSLTIPNTGGKGVSRPSTEITAWVPPRTSSSRQWSPEISFREGRGGNSSRRLRRAASTSSGAFFRPPTALFPHQGFESAAKLPVVSTPGGFLNRSSSAFRSARGGAIAKSLASTTATSFSLAAGVNSGLQSTVSSMGNASASTTSLCARSANMLLGLSVAASEGNLHGDRSMQRLCMVEEDEFASEPLMRKRGTGRFGFGSSFSENGVQDFPQAFASLTSDITELRRRHEDFVPGSSDNAAASSEKGRPGYPDGQALEDRKARLDVYKMARKVESELPPLTPLSTQTKAPKCDTSQEIVFRNTSQEAIDRWHPSVQKKLRAKRKEVCDERRRVVILQNEAILQKRVEDLIDLERSRARDPNYLSREKKMQFAKRWATAIVISTFQTRMQQELSMRRMSLTDMLEFAESNRGSLTMTLAPSEFVQNAVHINNCMKNKRVRDKFDLVARVFKFRKQIREKQNTAEVIYKSLSGWRTAGRALTAFLAFLQHVRRVQKWWRSVKPVLHQQRDEVSRRWAKLEREKLREEDLKARQAAQKAATEAGINDFRKQNRKVPTMLLINENVRNKFIENELRARRYMLLPQIELWERDRVAWKKEVQEWNETNQVYRLLGKASTKLPLFRWPPLRPSFMPPSHTSICDASGGKSCSESCSGRIGDAMISEMCERARINKQGWTRIKAPGHNDEAKSRRRCSIVQAMANDLDGFNGVTYGPPPSSADLRQHGAVTDMPGVHIDQGMPAMHGGQPRAWMSHLARATTTEVMGVSEVPWSADVSPVSVSRRNGSADVSPVSVSRRS